jgi:hypothetical protein
LHRTSSDESLPIQEVILDSNSGDDDSEEDEFVYPGVTAISNAQTETPLSPHATPLQRHPSPAQLESLYAAASSGDLSLLQKLFRTALQTGDVEAFALANDASSRTGLTALHAAASRGFLDVVKWCKYPIHILSWCSAYGCMIVVENCGAMPDLEDKEGEVSRQHHASCRLSIC